MKIFKAGADFAKALKVEDELEAINLFAKTELSADQVYTFSVVLCDNEVDRDFEKFSDEALCQLAELFVGITGIFDHEWKAVNQTARIYRTEIIREKGVYNSVGEPYVVLKGYAYMLRNEKNAGLIEEIDAGIKKETSVGCCVLKRVCSICGEDLKFGDCTHIPGKIYDGKLCYLELFDANDAYEWSFVAVPAQKSAGIVKRFGGADTLKDFVRSDMGSRYFSEYETLENDAILGREYKSTLRNEVLRLSLLIDTKIYEALSDSVKNMNSNELECLKVAFEKRLEDKFPVKTQLKGIDKLVSFNGDEYIV